MHQEVFVLSDEVKVTVRFQCNMYNQKDCSGFRAQPGATYCCYGLFERICYNQTLRIKYFVKECENQFFNKGHCCNKEKCNGKS